MENVSDRLRMKQKRTGWKGMRCERVSKRLENIYCLLNSKRAHGSYSLEECLCEACVWDEAQSESTEHESGVLDLQQQIGNEALDPTNAIAAQCVTAVLHPAVITNLSNRSISCNANCNSHRICENGFA